jgi:hypothetical protein
MPETIEDWNGREIAVVRSKGGVIAVCDFDNLIRDDRLPWPPPPVVQKLYESRQSLLRRDQLEHVVWAVEHRDEARELAASIRSEVLATRDINVTVGEWECALRALTRGRAVR